MHEHTGGWERKHYHTHHSCNLAMLPAATLRLIILVMLTYFKIVSCFILTNNQYVYLYLFSLCKKAMIEYFIPDFDLNRAFAILSNDQLLEF